MSVPPSVPSVSSSAEGVAVEPPAPPTTQVIVHTMHDMQVQAEAHSNPPSSSAATTVASGAEVISSVPAATPSVPAPVSTPSVEDAGEEEDGSDTLYGLTVPQKINFLPVSVSSSASPKGALPNLPPRPDVYQTRDATNTTLYHQVHQGNNTFLCNGRIMMGPNYPVTIATSFLILIPAVLFFVFPVADLMNRDGDGDATGLDSNVNTHALGIFCMAVGLSLLVSTEYHLYKTAFNNPGILPRLFFKLPSENTIAQSPEEKKKNQAMEQMQRIAIIRAANANRPRIMSVVNSDSVSSSSSSVSSPSISLTTDMKWCETCEIHRPPRTVHCNRCNSCIEKFDHHCPWIGSCVGYRNYRTFHFFLYSLSSLMLLMFISCAIHLAVFTLDLYHINQFVGNTAFSHLDSFNHTLYSRPYSFILLIINFCFSLFVFPLTSLHLFLVSKNLTTNEYLKGAYNIVLQDKSKKATATAIIPQAGVFKWVRGPNPNDLGFVANWREFLFPSKTHEAHFPATPFFQPMRLAALPPLMPHAHYLAIKEPEVMNVGVTIDGSHDTDANALSAHSVVRFVDELEMQQVADGWGKEYRMSKQLKSSSIPSPSPYVLPPFATSHAATPVDSAAAAFRAVAASAPPPATDQHPAVSLPAANDSDSVDYPSSMLPLISLPTSPAPVASQRPPKHQPAQNSRPASANRAQRFQFSEIEEEKQQPDTQSIKQNNFTNHSSSKYLPPLAASAASPSAEEFPAFRPPSAPNSSRRNSRVAPLPPANGVSPVPTLPLESITQKGNALPPLQHQSNWSVSSTVPPSANSDRKNDVSAHHHPHISHNSISIHSRHAMFPSSSPKGGVSINSSNGGSARAERLSIGDVWGGNNPGVGNTTPISKRDSDSTSSSVDGPFTHGNGNVNGNGTAQAHMAKTRLSQVITESAKNQEEKSQINTPSSVEK